MAQDVTKHQKEQYVLSSFQVSYDYSLTVFRRITINSDGGKTLNLTFYNESNDLFHCSLPLKFDVVQLQQLHVVTVCKECCRRPYHVHPDIT